MRERARERETGTLAIDTHKEKVLQTRYGSYMRDTQQIGWCKGIERVR